MDFDKVPIYIFNIRVAPIWTDHSNRLHKVLFSRFILSSTHPWRCEFLLLLLAAKQYVIRISQHYIIISMKFWCRTRFDALVGVTPKYSKWKSTTPTTTTTKPNVTKERDEDWLRFISWLFIFHTEAFYGNYIYYIYWTDNFILAILLRWITNDFSIYIQTQKPDIFPA